MTELDSPEYPWGRSNKPCKGCPTGIDVRGEKVCRHPWRVIIAACGGIVTENTIAHCWNIGASIAPTEVADGMRPSIELYGDKPAAEEGKLIFQIISTPST